MHSNMTKIINACDSQETNEDSIYHITLNKERNIFIPCLFDTSYMLVFQYVLHTSMILSGCPDKYIYLSKRIWTPFLDDLGTAKATHI